MIHVEQEELFSVLVVDDEESSLAVLDKILSSEYVVFTAKSGEEALRLAENEIPDLILLDILMPGMDGVEILSSLKRSETTRKIPVIFISALSGEDDEEKGFALGAVDYITKPFRNSIVQARVRTHMRIIRQMRMIEKTGLIDSLTDIPNRRSFDDRFNKEWRRCGREGNPISLLMMDLDKFKNYNDTYGHPQGDVLLRTVAKIVSSEAKRPSDLAARLGGEEFGLLLANTGIEGALLIAERIRSKVESEKIPTADGNTLTSMTISIGVVSTIPNDSCPALDFIRKADECLYAAKNAGRNRIFPKKP
jgi:diguanylate cyclase (GGDEF)-like protein